MAKAIMMGLQTEPRIMDSSQSNRCTQGHHIPYRGDRRLTRGNTEGDTLAISMKHSMDFRIFGSNIVTQNLNTTVPTPNHGWVNTY